jgi:hypothetical protein
MRALTALQATRLRLGLQEWILGLALATRCTYRGATESTHIADHVKAIGLSGKAAWICAEVAGQPIHGLHHAIDVQLDLVTIQPEGQQTVIVKSADVKMVVSRSHNRHADRAAGHAIEFGIAPAILHV